MEELQLLIDMVSDVSSTYIHRSDVDWLRDAMNEKLDREGKK